MLVIVQEVGKLVRAYDFPYILVGCMVKRNLELSGMVKIDWENDSNIS